MIYSIKTNELKEEIDKKISGCSEKAKNEIGCIILTMLRKSGLREGKDYYKTVSGDNYWHVILNETNIELLMNLR